MSWIDRLNDLPSLFDAMSQGLMVTDASARPGLINAAARRMLALAPIQMNTDYPGREEVDKVLASGLPVAVELDPGTGNTVVACFEPIMKDLRVAGAIGVFHDRSELDVLISRLGLANRDSMVLEAILSPSHDGLWLMDHNGIVILINRGAECIHELKKAEVIGKNIDQLKEMRVIGRSITREVFRHQASVTINQQLPRLNKEILVTAYPVFNERGELRFVVVVDRDVTELNRLRRELKASQELNERFRTTLPELLDSRSLIENGVIVSRAMKEVYVRAMKAARSDSTILLEGESGVGKGFMAKRIHQASSRRNGLFVQLDCGAVPASLIDSELFGYEKGAFTGARTEGKAGFMEAADGGTLFLDEISVLPTGAQVKLLRFLDEGEFVRVGGIRTRRSDARIIAAANRHLQEMVDSGEFRQDLFFQLNVVPITIPPLRERADALPRLIKHFLSLINAKNKTTKTINPRAAASLCRYSFPGNVRELINLIEQMVVLSPGQVIEPEEVPSHVREGTTPAVWTEGQGWNLRQTLDRLEKEMLYRAIKRFGSQRKAAIQLGVDPSTLARKAKKHGIRHELIIHRPTDG